MEPVIMSTLRAAKESDSPFEGGIRDSLEREGLPEFLKKQRWYAGKARELTATRIVDTAQSQDFPAGTSLILVEARYRQGDPETYFLPVRLADGAEAERRL